MAFDPFSFLKLATALRNNPSANESHYRTAVGRTYYGTFLLARTLAGIRIRSAEEHERVAEFVANIDVTAGNQYKLLRLIRNEADYELRKTFGGAEVSRAAVHAVTVLKALGVPHLF